MRRYRHYIAQKTEPVRVPAATAGAGGAAGAAGERGRKPPSPVANPQLKLCANGAETGGAVEKIIERVAGA